MPPWNETPAWGPTTPSTEPLGFHPLTGEHAAPGVGAPSPAVDKLDELRRAVADLTGANLELAETVERMEARLRGSHAKWAKKKSNYVRSIKQLEFALARERAGEGRGMSKRKFRDKRRAAKQLRNAAWGMSSAACEAVRVAEYIEEWL